TDVMTEAMLPLLEPAQRLGARLRRGPPGQCLECGPDISHWVHPRRCAESCSSQRVSVRGRIATGNVVFQLPLDIGQQRTGTKTEEIGMCPAIAQLLLHHCQPVERLAGSADATGRLEADQLTG